MKRFQVYYIGGNGVDPQGITKQLLFRLPCSFQQAYRNPMDTKYPNN